MQFIVKFLVLVLVLASLATPGIASASNPQTNDLVTTERVVPDLAARQIRFLASTTTPDMIRHEIERFVAMGPRIAGYAGADEAHRYIRSRFRSLGLRGVRTDTFEVVVPADRGDGEVVVSGTSGRLLKAWCLWPNGVRTSTTGPRGIIGPLLYGGTGTWEELDGKPVEGSVVLMDFGSGRNWINAASLGARAILFFDNGEVTREQAAAKFLSTSADLPRFWVEGEAADVMLGRISEEERNGKYPSVRLEGRMDWKSAPVYNVYGWIPGLDEALPAAARQSEQKWKDQVIVVQAYYDAMSVVPGLTPGAESAASITALLEIAAVLAQHRPDHTILFLATSAHFTGMEGINDFLYRHSRKSEYFRQLLEKTEIIDFDLMISLDLSSGGNRTITLSEGAFYPSDISVENQPGAMMAPQSRRLSLAVQQISNDSMCHVDGVRALQTGRHSDLPVPLALASESLAFVGGKALAVATANDERIFWDTPLDTPDRVDFANLAEQVQRLTAMVMWAGKDPLLLQPPAQTQDYGHSLAGTIYRSSGAADAADPVPVSGALVTYQQPVPNSIGGVRTLIVERTNAAGRFSFNIVRNRLANRIKAYEIDDETGAILSAPDRGPAGDELYPMKQPWGRRANEMRQLLFGSNSLSLFWAGETRGFVPHGVVVLGKDGDTLPQWGLDSAAELASVVFSPPDSRVKVSMHAGPGASAAVLRNVSPDLLAEPVPLVGADVPLVPEGGGYAIDQRTLVNPGLALGQDQWAAEAVRLQQLARYGMGDDRLAQLHEDARRGLLTAAEHQRAYRYSASRKEIDATWGLLASVHEEIDSLVEDEVNSFMFYFVLLLPLAYTLELVLLGLEDFRVQGLCTAGIFVVLMVLVRLVHPVFGLTDAIGEMVPILATVAAGGLTLMVVLGRVVQRWRRSPHLD